MITKLFNEHNWDIHVENDFFYFHRMDEYGENNSYHKSDVTNTWTITEDEYNVVKYGVNYKKFLSLLETNSDYSVKLSDGSVVCTGFRDYFFYFIDKEGNIIKKQEDIGFDSIYSFDIDKYGHIWFAIPTAHYIGQYSLEKSKEIFNLGERYHENTPLSFPEDIKVYGNHAYVSEMGNNRISKINIDSKELTEHLKFDESTWEYRQFKSMEIVRLQSGIYILE